MSVPSFLIKGIFLMTIEFLLIARVEWVGGYRKLFAPKMRLAPSLLRSNMWNCPWLGFTNFGLAVYIPLTSVPYFQDFGVHYCTGNKWLPYNPIRLRPNVVAFPFIEDANNPAHD